MLVEILLLYSLAFVSFMWNCIILQIKLISFLIKRQISIYVFVIICLPNILDRLKIQIEVGFFHFGLWNRFWKSRLLYSKQLYSRNLESKRLGKTKTGNRRHATDERVAYIRDLRGPRMQPDLDFLVMMGEWFRYDLNKISMRTQIKQSKPQYHSRRVGSGHALNLSLEGSQWRLCETRGDGFKSIKKSIQHIMCTSKVVTSSNIIWHFRIWWGNLHELKCG